MLERNFQAGLIRKLKDRLPGCMVLKNDPNYIQGIPDLLVVYKHHWAALECKNSMKASKRANQNYYIDRMNEMSYARFVCPENEEEILNELESSWKS